MILLGGLTIKWTNKSTRASDGKIGSTEAGGISVGWADDRFST